MLFLISKEMSIKQEKRDLLDYLWSRKSMGSLKIESTALNEEMIHCLPEVSVVSSNKAHRGILFELQLREQSVDVI